MSAAVDLQTVFDRFVPAHRSRHGLSAREGQVCAHIRDCRTGALGVLEQACGACGYRREYPASCRDRHCPKCQGRASAHWSEREGANLLPVMYYHVVFTVPSQLDAWVTLHPQAVYGQLFESAWSTLSSFAQTRLGGRLGVTAVLHTWGEQLTRHVHLHCLVPGGALDEDGQWHRVKGHYLFPVRALSRRFRGHFVAGLRRRAEAGALDEVPRRADVDAMLDALMARDWVVYAKPCLGHTDAVLGYLARYTHRIAISDRRLVAMDGERVALRCRDPRRGGARRTVWLDGVELVRRYLLHVLPKGFMRIRHYGLLANRTRREHLVRARAAIARFTPPAGVRPPRPVPGVPATPLCPRCRRLPLRTLCRRPSPRADTG
jgi:hypothetical protein